MASFQDLIQSKEPVIVDFYAEWCGPCKMMAPELQKAASQLSGKAKVVKVDIDKNQSAAATLAIQSVPTLMLFQNGKSNTARLKT
jgi:thioredoxin